MTKRRELLAEVEQMKNKQSVSSKQIPKMKKEGQDAAELMAEMKALSEKDQGSRCKSWRS